MTKSEILFLATQIEVLKENNPIKYEEIENIIKDLHNKKYNKVCSEK